MGLVDYSSDSSTDEEPPGKRIKATTDVSSSKNQAGDKFRNSSNSAEAPAKLPPLPDSFRDLYASTVRQSVSDDPSLHQGRKRVHPHVPGNWPSHVYVEWHPTTEQHDVLTRLFKSVEDELRGEVKLHSLLINDLGVPLPLHISLSRPLSLRTAEKNEFFDRITSTVRSSRVRPFHVLPCDLAWWTSPDSDRSFLILRVTTPGDRSQIDVDFDGDKDEAEIAAGTAAPQNAQLLDILTRCNMTASHFGHTPLYQRKHNEPVGAAFHLSIGWSFGRPSGEMCLRSLRVLKDKQFAEVRTWQVPVAGVKVKIGNAVHNVNLPGGQQETRRRRVP
ncbi:Phosphodiesterase [Geosmithia morbida]|uniref:U6 snRNA phosphodiesterase n=1 Tax=Geosmithia morbida TaxID=1094350 RepID=A0A9P4YXB6_9HYPO|nr:Phosphodiesterase [Geosmithia morbida]KAF4124808.1 Phosphodiesterase [Geosmithia morbida]